MEATHLRSPDTAGGAILADRMTSTGRAVVIIGAILGMMGGAQVFMSALGVFLKPMETSLGWSRADISLVPVAFLLGVGIGAPALGYIADRGGWNAVIAVSIVLYGLAMFSMSAAPATHMWIISISFFIGLVGAATSAAGYLSAISRAFDSHFGMAVGFAISGSSAAAALTPIVASKLLELMDWRQAYICLAAACLLLGFVAHRMIFSVMTARQHAGRSGATPKHESTASDSDEGLTLRQALFGYRFWLLILILMLTTGATAGLGVHFVAYATDRGVSLTLAVQCAGAMGFATAVAKVGAGFLLDRVFVPAVACVVFFVAAAGFYLLSTDILPSVWPLALAAILIGLAAGTEGDVFPFLLRKYFGLRAFGTIYGVMFSSAVLSAAVSTYVYGWLFVELRSYVPVIQFAVLLFCGSGVAMFTLGRYKY